MTNKQLRLSTAAILATSAVITTALPANVAEAATYKDVPKSANYYDAVQALTAQKIITGYADGTFKPNAKITRGQVAKILTRMLNLKPTTTMQFSDVAKHHDFYQYASAVVSVGLMKKENGKFNAKSTLTRNEYAEILMKAFNLTETTTELPFVDVSNQYKTAIRAVYANGFMKGVTKTRFNGNGEVTRSQLVLTLHKAIERGVDTDKGPEVGAKKVKFTLENIATTSITSDDGVTYKTTTELQKLFRATNAAILKDAEIEAYVKNGQITTLTKLTIFNPATSTVASTNTVGAVNVARTLNGNGGNFSFPIVIDGYNVTLKNMTVPQVITDDDASVGLTLEDVTVKDRVIIGYGYTRTFAVNVKNSNINLLEIQRDRTTVEANSKLPKVFVSEYAYDVTLNTAVGQLQFERDGYFTLYGDGSIDTVHVPLESSLYINNNGSIKTLKVDDPDARISLSSNTNIEQAIIPKAAKYNDIFYYPYGLQNFIAKINHPNSTKNLLADQVVKPSKEELAYQKAIENVIRGHVHSLSGTTLTIRTNFNEILPKMKDLAFDQMIYLAGPAPNDPYIPYAYFKNGDFNETGSLNVESLQYGISLQDFLGRSKNFGDFTSNSNESITLRFDTEREFKIRTTVFVGGQAKNTTETVINAGNEEKLKAALTAFVNSYTSRAMGNSLFSELKVNTPDEIAKKTNVDVEQQLKLHTDLQGVETLPLVIKKGNNTLFNGEVSVADLKEGIIVSKLPGMTAEKVTNFTGGSTTNYTYQFGTSEEMNVSASLLLDGKVQVEGEQVTLNSGTGEELDKLEPLYKAEAVANDGIKFTYDRLTSIPTIIENAPVGLKLKLPTGTIPTSKVKFEVKANGKTGTAEVTAAQLKAGVNVLQYATFDNTYRPLVLKDLTDGEVVEVKVLSAIKGEVEATALIGGREYTDIRYPNIQITKQESLQALYAGQSELTAGQTVASGFDVKAASNGIRVTTTFGAGDLSYASSNLDTRLKVVQGLSGDAAAERYISVYFNNTLVKEFVKVTNAQLTNGVLLSTILGQPASTVSSHAKNRTDNWDIIAHGNEDVLDIDVELLAIDTNNAETVLATASNIINKHKLEAMMKSFTLQKADKRYTLEAEFTGNENVDASWQASFVIAPKGSVAQTASAEIKVTRFDDTTAIPYGNTVTLTGQALQKGLNTSTLTFAGQTMDYKLLKNLQKAKWGFEFATEPSGMQAQFIVNDHIIKTVDETTTP